MKMFLMSAAVLSLIVAAPAMAQPDRHQDRHETHGKPGVTHSRPAPKAAPPASHQRPTYNTQRPAHSNQRPAHSNQGPAQANRPGAHPGQRPHARPNYSKYRSTVKAPRRYHAGVYHAPKGYAYRRWSYGQRLPSTYFTRSFWLMNFTTYGLFAPPSDAVWVRYGPDALLVDRYDGEIIRVVYGVFY
ncbi:MAG: RcnB family protein [Alphaproteobacteria bacterium]|nr:RcnB family protein [Alphaproteobacteria bacterium]MBN9566574.1 RcnB family protein [Alphaproteobacteria bacterium]OJU55765.1 MAG: hypothetical protein BGO00_00600 [Alphaproteobacteria bacterium 62-8]